MRKTLIIVVLLLSVANVLYWWPSEEGVIKDHSTRLPSYTKVDKLGDIRSLELFKMGEDSVKRDLFSPVKQKITSVLPTSDIQKEPLQIIQMDNRQNEKEQPSTDHMKRYSFVGVIVRNGTQSACILDGLNSIIVKAGDKLPDNIVVMDVSNTKLVIKDTTTGSINTMLLSGE